MHTYEIFCGEFGNGFKMKIRNRKCTPKTGEKVEMMALNPPLHLADLEVYKADNTEK